MKLYFGLISLCIIFCLRAPVQIIPIETDNSVASQIVMNYYAHLPERLQASVKFYRVNSGRVYWVSNTLKCIASTNTYAQEVHSEV
jgi:hypothetical protein